MMKTDAGGPDATATTDPSGSELSGAEPSGDNAAPPPSAVDQFAASIGSRNLTIIIVTMPIVFLVLISAIIITFGGDDEEAAVADAAPTQTAPVSEPVAAAEPAADPIAAPAPVFEMAGPIELPPGAVAGAVSLDGDRLAVRVDGPEGGAVIIYDLAEGAVIQTIPIVKDDAPR